ncbi:MAG: hydrogenase maturation nickel metallochaperone HypA [Sulfurimonas sp.]|nr:hydrogenase maturation nickel metallochaperone HypA [Sulfurimonas sp.]
MYEYSIVQSLIDICEEHVKTHNASRVTKVVVKIGVLSGVETHLFIEALNMFREGTLCSEAELVLNIQKVRVHCNNCGIELDLEKNDFICPDCSSCDLDVLNGEEMYLISLEMD